MSSDENGKAMITICPPDTRDSRGVKEPIYSLLISLKKLVKGIRSEFSKWLALVLPTHCLNKKEKKKEIHKNSHKIQISQYLLKNLKIW